MLHTGAQWESLPKELGLAFLELACCLVVERTPQDAHFDLNLTSVSPRG
ncbi:hypothetical protein [Streptomyces sp. OV198]|nr:hypothetical protein [Streptomyces sp. OV198]